MRYFALFFLNTVFFLQTNAQVLWQISKDTVITYYYEDGDEFNLPILSKEKWGSWFGWARSIASNKEQQYYSDYMNHEMNDGCLNLTVNKKNLNARLIDWKDDKDTIKDGNKFLGLNKRDFKYSAGLIRSQRKYLKGYFEIKFKAPKESGLWPAFWLYGGTPNEEIDFMELNGVHQDRIHVDTHCPNHCDYVKYFYVQNKSFGGWIKLNGGLDEGYNIVSGIWDDNEIRYYLNGEFIAVSKVKFAGEKELVANIAVPSNNGPFKPGPDTSIVNFSPMSIDYIRVWTKDQSKMSPENIITDSDNSKASNRVRMKKPVKPLYGKSKKRDNKCVFVSILKDKEGLVELFCNGLTDKETCNVKLKDASGKIVFEKEVSDVEFKIPSKPEMKYKLEITYSGKTALYTF